MINLEHLSQFLTVVEYMNFTKAADHLFISHSTISRNISALEQELGAQLFIRYSRAVRLTAAGRILAERAPTLFQAVDDMREETIRAAQKTGVLDISSPILYDTRLLDAFRRFNEQWPKYELLIRHLPVEQILPLVASKSTDIGVLFDYMLPDETSGLEVTPVLKGSFRVVVPDNHPLAGLESVDAEDSRLDDVLVIGRQEFDFVRKIGRSSAQLSASTNRPYSYLTLESIILQVMSGKGIALLPEHVIAGPGEGYSVLKLTGVHSGYQIVICRRKDNANPALPIFLEYLK
jgi:DNA-binding transcriptional LysR family regulator